MTTTINQHTIDILVSQELVTEFGVVVFVLLIALLTLKELIRQYQTTEFDRHLFVLDVLTLPLLLAAGVAMFTRFVNLVQ